MIKLSKLKFKKKVNIKKMNDTKNNLLKQINILWTINFIKNKL